jgi:hypothetical protein
VHHQGVLPHVRDLHDAGTGLRVEHHAQVPLGAEPDRLAVAERDEHLLADLLGGHALEGAVVEDVAVLEHLDEGGALVLVGTAEDLEHVGPVHVVRAGHEAGLGADGQRQRVERVVEAAERRRLGDLAELARR